MKNNFINNDVEAENQIEAPEIEDFEGDNIMEVQRGNSESSKNESNEPLRVAVKPKESKAEAKQSHHEDEDKAAKKTSKEKKSKDLGKKKKSKSKKKDDSDDEASNSDSDSEEEEKKKKKKKKSHSKSKSKKKRKHSSSDDDESGSDGSESRSSSSESEKKKKHKKSSRKNSHKAHDIGKEEKHKNPSHLPALAPKGGPQTENAKLVAKSPNSDSGFLLSQPDSTSKLNPSFSQTQNGGSKFSQNLQSESGEAKATERSQSKTQSKQQPTQHHVTEGGQKAPKEKKADKDEDNGEQQKEDLDSKFDEPFGPFSISRNQLIRLATAAQQRNFSEEVDMLESLGGSLSIVEGLRSNVKKGISGTQEDYEARNSAFGNNLTEVQVPKGFFELFYDALQDFTMKILMVAAVLSIAIEVGTASSEKRSTAWIEGFAVLVAVFVCATVTAVNDYQKERQFQELNSEADKRKIVTVYKDGQKENKHQSFVMVGDVIDLVEGMEVPADGILIEASELTTDESAMTGETDPMKKNLLADCIKKREELIQQGLKNTSTSHEVPSPLLLSGTKILTGQGKMMIIVVGEYSCVGKISKLLNSKEGEVTPLQEKLEAIAMDIGNMGLKSAIVIVLVLFIRFGIEKIIQNSWDHSHDWAEMLEFFIIGITVVVVAIPEGLPLSVTLSLAYSVKKMLKDNNLVRKLQACETMGGADCICSDKTGTLTQNKMTLTTWWNEEEQEFNKYGDTDKLENYISKSQAEFQQLFLQSCAINCSADLRPDEKGSKTEVAVLKLLEKFGEKYEKWREDFPTEKMFPFSSARKRMSCIIHSNGKRILLVKGASEMVLASCNKFHSKTTGTIRVLDDAMLDLMKTAIKKMADNALRTIVLAYKELKDSDEMETKNNLGVYDIETKDLVCISIFGIKDILREEVPGAVKQCQDAGIKVRMVTGDNSDTARAIARDCNILTKTKKPSPYQVIEGIEFIKLTGGIVCKKCKTAECDCVRDSEQAEKEGKSLRIDTIKNGEVFDKIYKHIDVMARSRPEDKYAMVVGLIERKHVVAVTGDGTNDAPALKRADVGFAMGIAGTEVARGAAAIILLDDNFSSIVKAVLWGRNIYDSIKKFLQFQLTVNIVAVVITLIGAAVIKQQVLQPIQMLWINLIMDTFASLALATEPPLEELLLRKPHNREEYIVSKKMFKHIFGQAIYQLVIMMIVVFSGETFLPEAADSWDDEIRKNTLFGPWWKAKYYDEQKTLVRSGRLMNFNGVDKEYQLVIDEFSQPSRHFTAVFNIFVWMQIFNFLNARKLQYTSFFFNFYQRNKSFFQPCGLLNNPMFIGIVFFIIGLQILLVSVGGTPFSCYKLGLNWGNWGVSIAFGLGSLVWGFFLKFISEDKCAQFGGKKKINPLVNPSRVLSLKGSRDEQSMSRRYSVLVQHPVPKPQ